MMKKKVSALLIFSVFLSACAKVQAPVKLNTVTVSTHMAELCENKKTIFYVSVASGCYGYVVYQSSVSHDWFVCDVSQSPLTTLTPGVNMIQLQAKSSNVSTTKMAKLMVYSEAYSENTVVDSVTVVQYPSYIIIADTLRTLNFSGEQVTGHRIEYLSNSECSTKSSEAWLTASLETDLQSKKYVVLDLDANDTGEARKATVTVSSKYGQSKSISVEQDFIIPVQVE